MSPATLELWQTEWCPGSHRVRQQLTELGLTYVADHVPVEAGERTELDARTAQRTIPVLVTPDGQIVRDEQAIISYLESQYLEPAGADAQREKAATAKRKELEQACPELIAVTH